VEALACGTPIVITDAGGADEVVTESTYGRIALRDSAAFAAAIADVRAAAPAQAAVRRGAERFTWEANTAALYAHLRGLCAPKADRHSGSATSSPGGEDTKTCELAR
jgi:glycosyltransferase involved in cell wall biosynthesis